MKPNENQYIIEINDPQLLKVIKGWRNAEVIGKLKGVYLALDFNTDEDETI